MSRTILYLIVCFSLMLSATGCRSDAQMKVPPDKTLHFLDSQVFDLKLSRSLEADLEQVEVIPSPEIPLSVQHIPPKLDKWLMIVDQSGGQVRTQSTERGLGMMLIDLIIGIYDLSREKLMYRPAKEYDATVYYKGGGVIDRVVFTRRAADNATDIDNTTSRVDNSSASSSFPRSAWER